MFAMWDGLKKYHSSIYTFKHTLMKCKTWQQNMVAIGSVVFLLLFTSIFYIFKANFWKDKIYTWSPNYFKAFISYNMVALYIHIKAYQCQMFLFLFLSPALSKFDLWFRWSSQVVHDEIYKIGFRFSRLYVFPHIGNPFVDIWQVGLRTWETSGLISDIQLVLRIP